MAWKTELRQRLCASPLWLLQLCARSSRPWRPARARTAHGLCGRSAGGAVRWERRSLRASARERR